MGFGIYKWAILGCFPDCPWANLLLCQMQSVAGGPDAWLSRNRSPTVFHQALWDCSEGKWLYFACRHWQDLGYLIIYITGRPDMQKQRVVSWHQALWDCSEGKWLYFACRHWQDLGYLIIYITGRPDMQKQRVVSWLSQHNFPQGMIFFSEGLVHDPLRQKTIFLRNLVQEVSLLLPCPHIWYMGHSCFAVPFEL